MKKNTQRNRGFTLIEIMVVVVIIGLLATLVGPRIWSMLGFGQERIASAKCKEYHDSAKTWRMVNKKYPDSLEEMEAPLSSSTTEDFIRVEKDPWGNDYLLERTDKGIVVWCWGPDGQEQTDDDISYPDDRDDE